MSFTFRRTLGSEDIAATTTCCLHFSNRVGTLEPINLGTHSLLQCSFRWLDMPTFLYTWHVTHVHLSCIHAVLSFLHRKFLGRINVYYLLSISYLTVIYSHKDILYLGKLAFGSSRIRKPSVIKFFSKNSFLKTVYRL